MFMDTDTNQMKRASWSKIISDVCERVHALKLIVEQMEGGPLDDKICNELILPAVHKLDEFCEMVIFHEERDNREKDVELRLTTGNMTDSYMTTIETR